MSIQDIFQHILLSLVPWLIGSAIGGLIGFVLAAWIKDWCNRDDKNIRRLLLIPWRTMILITMLIVFSPLMVIWVGLGNIATFLMVTSFIFLLALPIATNIFLDNWSSLSKPIQITSTVRSLATFSIVLTIWVSIYSFGGGLGSIMLKHMRVLEFNLWLTTWLVVGAITLVVDILLGILQLLIFRLTENRTQHKTLDSNI